MSRYGFLCWDLMFMFQMLSWNYVLIGARKTDGLWQQYLQWNRWLWSWRYVSNFLFLAFCSESPGTSSKQSSLDRRSLNSELDEQAEKPIEQKSRLFNFPRNLFSMTKSEKPWKMFGCKPKTSACLPPTALILEERPRFVSFIFFVVWQTLAPYLLNQRKKRIDTVSSIGTWLNR